MPQPEFSNPDFIENNTAEEIHERMMNNMPSDIDDMQGSFPYDFTMPAALEKDEFINYHLVRAIMIAFPQYAWDEWLDLHGQQVHIGRHQPDKAYGHVKVVGTAGTIIFAGTIFCTTATDTGPSIEFESIEDSVIGDTGEVLIAVSAVESGTASNVGENSVVLMAKPNKNIISVNNPEPIIGGTERESNDNYYDRIAAEYDSSMTYLGTDADYIRWAKQAGAGDCIVVPVAEGPGTVKLILVDGNGQPANEKLVQDVYNYIVSTEDRSKRLLPTACAKLICASATTIKINYVIGGLLYDETTSIEQIKIDFSEKIKEVYTVAKHNGILRYNDVRPIIKGIAGLIDYEEFLMDGSTENIKLENEEYPETGELNFSELTVYS